MAAKYLNLLRKSESVKTIFSLFISNLIAYGQPVMMAIDYHLASEKVIYNVNSTADNIIIEDEEIQREEHIKDAFSEVQRKTQKSNVFYAEVQTGIIGKSFETDTENPTDNFLLSFYPITLARKITAQCFHTIFTAWLTRDLLLKVLITILHMVAD